MRWHHTWHQNSTSRRYQSKEQRKSSYCPTKGGQNNANKTNKVNTNYSNKHTLWYILCEISCGLTNAEEGSHGLALRIGRLWREHLNHRASKTPKQTSNSAFGIGHDSELNCRKGMLTFYLVFMPQCEVRAMRHRQIVQKLASRHMRRNGIWIA